MKRSALVAGIVGLFAVVMLAASVQGIPTITPPTLPPGEADIPSDPAPTATPDSGPPPEATNDIVGMIISILFLLVGAAVVIVLGIVLVRALMRAWRDRPLRVREGDDAAHDLGMQDLTQEADAAAPAIRRGIEGALRSIDDRVAPTDAIIAAWVGLEESAADAGLSRGLSETPSEFAVRIITRRAGITEAARDLLRLYERVRFGGYVAEETDRAAARAALRLIEEGWR
ncbi:DUF4129 domain-containing protein [Microbacterium sp.]|uniref:DUF4129 domain-containing protein n=1 Tax=Microbacterium sp. TaxID=51671 RepID=UPI003F951801